MTVTDLGSSVTAGGAAAWQPIETADKSEDAAPIDVWLVVTRHGEVVNQRRVSDVIWGGDGWVSDEHGDEPEWIDNIGQQARITHWMPLPLPPANVGAVETRERITDGK